MTLFSDLAYSREKGYERNILSAFDVRLYIASLMYCEWTINDCVCINTWIYPVKGQRNVQTRTLVLKFCIDLTFYRKGI
jgi:hypothetical protein